MKPLLSLPLLLTLALWAAPNEPAHKGTFERIKVHGKSLEGNLAGDSPDRDVSVYLPPSYATDRARRYPVVYLLHGMPGSPEEYLDGTQLTAFADTAIADGLVRPFVAVMPEIGRAHV